MGHSAAWDQHWDKAAAAYRKALGEFPNHPKALSSMGLALTPDKPTGYPTTSTLNFPYGDTRANAVTVPLGTGGVLWVTFTFAGTLGLNRSMAVEKDRGCLDGLLLAYGVFVAARSKLDVFPDFVPPQVTIQAEAPGLAPEQVEQLVTRPLESAINGLGDQVSLLEAAEPTGQAQSNTTRATSKPF